MTSASVFNCSKVLVNENCSLIESNVTNLDLTWNWLFKNCFIFETKTIGANRVIRNNVLGYFNMINLIYSNFYGFGIHCDCQYDSYGMIKLQCIMFLLMYCYETSIIMLLLLLLQYYFIVASSKRNSHFCVALVICYDYELTYNVSSNNINNTFNKYDLLNESYDNNECRIRWNKRNKKYKIMNNVIDSNIACLLVWIDDFNLIMANDNFAIQYRYFINIYLFCN